MRKIYDEVVVSLGHRYKPGEHNHCQGEQGEVAPRQRTLDLKQLEPKPLPHLKMASSSLGLTKYSLFIHRNVFQNIQIPILV